MAPLCKEKEGEIGGETKPNCRTRLKKISLQVERKNLFIQGFLIGPILTVLSMFSGPTATSSEGSCRASKAIMRLDSERSTHWDFAGQVCACVGIKARTKVRVRFRVRARSSLIHGASN